MRNNFPPYFSQKLLTKLKNGVIANFAVNKFLMLFTSCQKKWGYHSALFFTGTLASTVGYGKSTPHTFYGRMFCIFFSTVGMFSFFFHYYYFFFQYFFIFLFIFYFYLFFIFFLLFFSFSLLLFFIYFSSFFSFFFRFFVFHFLDRSLIHLCHLF